MSEINNLKKRVRDLAKEKSRFQMVSTIMTELADVSGLDNMVHHIVYTLMDVWGGKNVILYYLMEEKWFRRDVFQEAEEISDIKDPLVRQVIETGKFLELNNDEEGHVQKKTPDSNSIQETWIYPLKIGSDMIAVIKMEGIFLNSTENIKEILGLIMNYFSLALKSEIMNASRLLAANKELKQEIAQRMIEEERYKKTIESSFDGFWIVDRKGRFLDVNEAFCEMSGYSREELLNMSIGDVENLENEEETRMHIRDIILKKRLVLKLSIYVRMAAFWSWRLVQSLQRVRGGSFIHF